MIEIALAVGAFAGLVLLVILFRMREKYYTRAGIQTPRFGRNGTRIGSGIGSEAGGRDGDGTAR